MDNKDNEIQQYREIERKSLKFPEKFNTIDKMKEQVKAKKSRKSAHKLTCQISGTTRQSNQFYIKKRADKAGTTPEEFQAHYVSKESLVGLKDALSSQTISEVKQGLGWDTITLVKVLKYNGRGINLDYYKSASIDMAKEEATVTEVEDAVLVTAGEAE